MKVIFILVTTTGFFFIFFFVLLIIGLARKKRRLIIASFTIFFCFVGFAAWTGYTFLTKSINQITGALKSRTGEEIYVALFGQDESSCVRVIKSQDQIIPKIDIAIWLKFETCPAEMKRILAQHKFDFDKLETAIWMENVPYGEAIDWINPKEMGDTIFVFEFSSEDGKNAKTLWTSRDSTKVLYRDIYD